MELDADLNADHMNMMSNTISTTDPSPATARVCHDLEAKEDRDARVRRFEMRQLRAGPDCASVLDRGAEDREEGAERDTREEDGEEIGGEIEQWSEHGGVSSQGYHADGDGGIADQSRSRDDPDSDFYPCCDKIMGSVDLWCQEISE